MPCRRKAKHKSRHRLRAIKAISLVTGLKLKAPDEKPAPAPQPQVAVAEAQQPAAS